MTHPIVPRDLDVDFAAVPRHWLAGNATATAISNGVNLLFPHGERFFVRSVKHFLDQIDDPMLRAADQGLLRPGGPPRARARRFNEILRAQGFEIDRFLDQLQAARGVDRGAHAAEAAASRSPPRPSTSPRSSPRARSRSGVLDAAAPEHARAARVARRRGDRAQGRRVRRAPADRSVVRAAHRRPRAARPSLLGGFWLWGAIDAAAPGRPARARPRCASCARLRDAAIRSIRRVFVRGIRQYLRRDFHPRTTRNEHARRGVVRRAWYDDAGGRMKLADKIVVVTGAGSGIGRATALAFAAEGARIAACDVDQARARRARARARRRGRCSSRKVDVADRARMAAFADAGPRAGPGRRRHRQQRRRRGRRRRSSTPALDDWDWLLGVNLRGVVHGCHFFLPKMVERGAGGHVINVSLDPRHLPGAEGHRLRRVASSRCSASRSRCAPSSRRTGSASPRSARA